ncbi:diacylglycerol/lipid kinase family protein [Enterococcus pallens]|uniref:YegS BmrU family lipid kinase n=1 Tax=Enterococcus pallens ATCC BAA-351 TaxID=1158607 RepID=R2PTF8_9ENTE|nr:YegS/Rv2252/BmrU family lipid kinase [Enterococcus pallens]EOH87867.1 YegS//BmrU family lipid kinase [Enterococcus pallens ATCC BAA-351]EOU18081.1 hypothetical protein I588_03070 [Enterococcus pallens ATCC BAA-351]OJG82296.1 YegS//BmrU family lipid kinase [Enterococcus pallens]
MNFHYHLLINPAAGSGTANKKASQLIDLFDQNDFTYTPYYTTYAGEEKEIVKRLIGFLTPWDEELLQQPDDEPYHLLIVVGGDGTLHQVVNQFYLTGVNLPISYLPAGSGNDFARGIGLSLQVESAFRQITGADRPQKINVLLYEEKISEEYGLVLNNVGIGLDALIVATTNASASKKLLNKYKLGFASYGLYLIKALLTQKTFPILVEINGHKQEFNRTFLCTTTNIPYFGGGIPIAPMADPRKEMIDLVVIEKPNLFAIIRLLLQLLQKKHTNNRHYRHFSSSRIRIVSVDPQHGQADGENMGQRSYDLYFSTSSQYIWYTDKQ